jgi:hypothetical protein
VKRSIQGKYVACSKRQGHDRGGTHQKKRYPNRIELFHNVNFLYLEGRPDLKDASAETDGSGGVQEMYGFQNSRTGNRVMLPTELRR